MTEPVIGIDSPLGRALIQAQGVIESGAIANMRTYLLPIEAKTHTRILGTDRTLCGRSLDSDNDDFEDEPNYVSPEEAKKVAYERVMDMLKKRLAQLRH